ncbi:MAG: response regulator [Lachnospiraceae bacterium]|nr:response regulator [Lachnospiraceae bacterium]
MEKHTSKVLIVDDMPVNRMVLASLLAADGIQSEMAENGMQCLELCRKNHYDLILLDHRMPDLDGVDTLLQLKNLFRRSGEEIPVVCHTGEDARRNINLYKAAGFADVLIKPIDPQQLLRILMTYLPEGKQDAALQSAALQPELEKELVLLPDWLKTVPRLDLSSGIVHCGSSEEYLNSLRIFVSSIAVKSAEIEKFIREKNWTLYALRMHSLKSTSALIGALSLSDLAADLEYAGKQELTEKILEDTPVLLADYRQFEKILRHFEDKISVQPPTPIRSVKEPARPHSVLYVSGSQGFVSKGVIKHLQDAGFSVCCVADDTDAVLDHRFDADLILYYASGEKEHIRAMSSHIAEICGEDRKIYCIVGDPADLQEASLIRRKDLIRAQYPRPINLNRFVEDIMDYSNMQSESRRKKSILVIDDDPDFLAIMNRRLKEHYKTDCLQSGTDALFYLNNITPDLVLLDYEMPGLDGCQVLQQMRRSPHTHRIPVIFLTGKNERENVMKILQYKPAGYLLKSMRREDMLNALECFFEGKITAQSLP